MKRPIRSQSRWVLLAARVFAAVVAVGWGWYIVAAFRTQQFGFSPAMLGVSALFVLPAAVIPFAGMRWPRVGLGAAAVLLTALVSAEAFAAGEEAAFRHSLRAQAPGDSIVFQNRQWPFSDHYMFHNPTTGQWGGGD